MTVRDRFDRPLQDLRVSVTDRCNLRCPYCMPRDRFGADHAFLERAELLSFEEITRVVTILAGAGVSKLRLTGGEPLLRRELERLVEMLARVPGIEDMALTTNGLLLERHAGALARAGLRRVTVSLDSLDRDVLRTTSDAPVEPRRILDAIDAAHAAGLAPVKVNMVVRRGVNDHCVCDMAEHFRFSGVVVRFIEYMDVGTTNGWPAAELVRAISGRWPLEPLAPARAGEVATRYRYLDGGGEIGFIHSVSEPFCGGCTRARLSADGRLFTCLFAQSGHDLRALLRAGADDAELAASIGSIWSAREDRYSQLRGRLASRGDADGRRVEMSYVGG
jgi:cyclic pyranopterin phosphate synthase